MPDNPTANSDSANSPRIGVFVVDDDLPVLESLSKLLAAASFDVECFQSAEEFLQKTPNGRRGCLLVDLRMPGMSGLELCERLRVEQERIPVVVLTAHGDIESCTTLMKHGAVDFLEKPCPPERLLASIELALAEDAKQNQLSQQHKLVAECLARLKPTEEAVMNRLVLGMSNKEIAEELEVALRTVQLRRASLMKKMGAKSLEELVTKVIAYRQATSP